MCASSPQAHTLSLPKIRIYLFMYSEKCPIVIYNADILVGKKYAICHINHVATHINC